MLKNVLLISLPLTIVLAQGGYDPRPSWSWGLPRSTKPTPHSSLNPHCMPTGAPLAKLAESKAAWPTCGTLESLQLCHGTRSTAVERVVKEICPHTCNACEAVDVTQVARSVGIEIRKPESAVGRAASSKLRNAGSCCYPRNHVGEARRWRTSSLREKLLRTAPLPCRHPSARCRLSPPCG